MGNCSPDSARFVSIHDNPARYARRFQKDQSVIARHIANVFKEGELDRDESVSKPRFAYYWFLFKYRLHRKHRFSLFFFREIRVIPCLKEIVKHIFSYPLFISAALPFYLFLSVRFQVFIRLAEMFVSEETVVCGKRRRVCGCQYQVFVAIDKSTFSLCISSP